METFSVEEAEAELKPLKPIPLELLQQFVRLDLSLEGFIRLWSRIDDFGAKPEFKALQTDVIPKIMARVKSFDDLNHVYVSCVGKPRWLALKAMPSKATTLDEWLKTYALSHYTEEDRASSENWYAKQGPDAIAEHEMIYEIENEVNKIAFDNIMMLAQKREDWILILREGRSYDILRETALDKIADGDMHLKMWLKILRDVLKGGVSSGTVDWLKKIGMTFDILQKNHKYFPTDSGGYHGALVLLMMHFAKTSEEWFEVFRCSGGMVMFGRFSVRFVGDLQWEIMQNMQKFETGPGYWFEACKYYFFLVDEKLKEKHKAIFFDEVFKRNPSFDQLFQAYEELYKLEGPQDEQLSKLVEVATTKEELEKIKKKCWENTDLEKMIIVKIARLE